MTKAHHLKARKTEALAPKTLPINFLLSCSDSALGNFELGKLSMVANLRLELHSLLDRLIDEMAQAGIAAWFRTIDRNDLRQVLEHPEDVLEWAKGQIRDRGEEEEELILLPSLPAGGAHLATAMRYQERNIAEGLCSLCPKPLARNSVRYCEKHLTAARLRTKPINAKGSQSGSVGWLYGEGFESQHGRQPRERCNPLR